MPGAEEDEVPERVGTCEITRVHQFPDRLSRAHVAGSDIQPGLLFLFDRLVSA
jgi:hypothetical protein